VASETAVACTKAFVAVVGLAAGTALIKDDVKSAARDELSVSQHLTCSQCTPIAAPSGDIPGGGPAPQPLQEPTQGARRGRTPAPSGEGV
jgi:hypothetical protein